MHIALPVGCELSGRTATSWSPSTSLSVPQRERHNVQYPGMILLNRSSPLPLWNRRGAALAKLPRRGGSRGEASYAPGRQFKPIRANYWFPPRLPTLPRQRERARALSSVLPSLKPPTSPFWTSLTLLNTRYRHRSTKLLRKTSVSPGDDYLGDRGEFRRSEAQPRRIARGPSACCGSEDHRGSRGKVIGRE